MIVCRHSPYFINWEAITAGAQLVRVVKEEADTKCYTITDTTRSAFKNLMKDVNNPHVLVAYGNGSLHIFEFL